MIVGIEVGGTFTDLVLVDGNGGLTVHKVPSTPADPSIAAVSGMQEILAKTGCPAASVTELLHGSTIAANALIQRRGARMALITTLGFRDVLFIHRQDKSSVYDIFYQKPAPLIGRDAAFEIEERIDAQGRVVTPLSDSDINCLVDEISPTVSARNRSPSACCTPMPTRRMNSASHEPSQRGIPIFACRCPRPYRPNTANTNAPARR